MLSVLLSCISLCFCENLGGWGHREVPQDSSFLQEPLALLLGSLTRKTNSIVSVSQNVSLIKVHFSSGLLRGF